MTLFRRRDDGFSEVLPAWTSDTVVILGSGPSLTPEQCEHARARGARVIAINNAYLLAPWADVLYFGDKKWLERYGNGARAEFRAFRGEKATIEEDGKKPGDPRFNLLHNLGIEGLSSDPAGIFNGRTSGYAAINLAVLAGAQRIVLLGYDFRHVDGRDHFPGGEHPDRTFEIDLSAHAAFFGKLAPMLRGRGIDVVNATPGSRLSVFPRVPLDLVRWFAAETVT